MLPLSSNWKFSLLLHVGELKLEETPFSLSPDSRKNERDFCPFFSFHFHRLLSFNSPAEKFRNLKREIREGKTRIEEKE